MTDEILQDGDVVVRAHGALRRLKAVMVVTISSVMALSACGRLSVMRRSAP